MDKFENAIAKQIKTPAIARMNREKARSMCVCTDCPTYTDCASNARERMFCGTGRSFICISEEKDCICPTCPVATNVGLTRNFYCNRGPESSQRWDAELIAKM